MPSNESAIPDEADPPGTPPSVDAFREELRSWLGEHLTTEIIEAGHTDPTSGLEPLREWNRRLADAGWAAPAWAPEWGGRNANIDEQLAYLEEMSDAEAPGPVNVIGVSNIAPAIMTWGTDEQKAEYLAPMLRGDVIWSQGMSEPDAGSDLASLRTTAVADGDAFVINGQKTWNSLGHVADMCQLYVRTDPSASKHRGISCLLVDLRTPGIEARPLRTITGESTFAELFFSDARVPVDSLLGPLNGGWQVAMTTLGHERAGVARLHVMLSRRFASLINEPDARLALSDPVQRDRLMSIYSQITCMRWMTERSFAQLRQGGEVAATFGSLTKLAWSRAEQNLADAALGLLGIHGTSGTWSTNLASARQASIAGGTTEINKNIVAEHGLGLPR